ncbi:hypothetical protein LCGC14_2605930, partial [marine sediment metagenome]
MKIINAPILGGEVRPEETTCLPKTFRLGERRVAYYPDDMALHLLDGGERALER